MAVTDQVQRRQTRRVAPTLVRPPSWTDRAACAKTPDDDLWFPGIGASVAVAKSICRSCPVVTECLTWALDNRISHGIWGGTSEHERRGLRRRSA